MNHAEIAQVAIDRRETAVRQLRELTENAQDRPLARNEKDRESELLDLIADEDAKAKRHISAAAAEEAALRVMHPLRGAGSASGADRYSNETSSATPGELMHRSLELSRGITTTATGKAFSPEQVAKNFVDLLAPQSVVMASGVNRVETDAETYSFPVIKSDFSAGFVGELDDLPTGGFGAEPLKVKPKKIAVADLIANELIQDGGPAFLNPMAKSLLRTVALGFDREALVGTGTGKGFVGIANTTGIQKLAVTGGLKDLDPFVSAFGLLESANAKASAIVMSPTSWTSLMALRETSGSLKPLLSESAGSPAAGIQRSILGIPVWLSSFMSNTDILIYEADQIFAVWRKDAGFEISNHFGFLKDGAAVRAIARSVIAVPNAAAVCKITISA
ncbi:phage major capsid protein [Kitasatospora sp. NPDC094019]|uniref:phage major capsid protein n=1 Tax=Kitasatospora sp. NPDC094019 TaxID=3364091 RepID=UPI0037FFDBD3